MSDKPKIKVIEIRVVDNGYIFKTSIFSDGSDSSTRVFRKADALVNALLESVERFQ